MDNNWQDKLRKDFEDYSESAPEGLWDAVEEGVSAKWSTVERRKKRRTIFFSSLSAATAAAAVVVLFLVQKNIDATDIAVVDSGTTVAEAISTEDVSESPETSIAVVQDATENLIAQQNPTFFHHTKTSSGASSPTEKDHSPKEGIVIETKDNTTAAVSDEAPVDEMVADESVTVGNNVSSEAATSVISTDSVDSQTENHNYFEEDDIPERHSVAERLSFSVSASNITGNSSSTPGYNGLYGSEVAQSMCDPMAVDTKYFSAVLMENNQQEIATETKHYQPIKFGVSVAYRMTKRLSLETGATYTFLISELTSGTTANSYDTRQVLHYIGIPLNLGVSLWNNDRFDIYLSAGGMLEKCVYGTSQTTYKVYDHKDKGETGRITVKPLQWSVNAAVGAQYSFNHLIGLYLEPGVNYYFDNGSFVETIYSQKPWNFNLRLGLRFSF